MEREHNIVNSLSLVAEELERLNFERYERYKAVEENEKSFDKLLDNDEKETFLRLVKKLRYGLENN